MLWIKNYHKIGFGILLSAFFAVFSSFFFLNTKVSAIQDKVITLTSSSDYLIFCDSSSPCSDYNYLIIEADSSVPNNSSFTLTANKFPSGSLYNLLIPLRSKFLVLKLDNLNISASNFLNFRVTSFDNFSSGIITLTFSESFGSAPSGSITLTENGSFDVSSYATAVVDVPPTIEPGDYHDDLLSIQQAIYVCGAILLVLYFFYCIYRMIIKTTGGYL